MTPRPRLVAWDRGAPVVNHDEECLRIAGGAFPGRKRPQGESTAFFEVDPLAALARSVQPIPEAARGATRDARRVDVARAPPGAPLPGLPLALVVPRLVVQVHGTGSGRSAPSEPAVNGDLLPPTRMILRQGRQSRRQVGLVVYQVGGHLDDDARRHDRHGTTVDGKHH